MLSWEGKLDAEFILSQRSHSIVSRLEPGNILVSWHERAIWFDQVYIKTETKIPTE